MDGEDPTKQIPPSAKLVCVVLDRETPLIRQAPADPTWLWTRTVRTRVRRLERLEVAELRRYWQGTRRRIDTLRGEQ